MLKPFQFKVKATLNCFGLSTPNQLSPGTRCQLHVILLVLKQGYPLQHVQGLLGFMQ